MLRRTYRRMSRPLAAAGPLSAGAPPAPERPPVQDVPPAPAPPPRQEAPPAARFGLLETTINGLAYYKGDERRVSQLRPGERLVLRREPMNRYDARAVAVYSTDDEKLGFLPREDNMTTANLADQGWTLEAEVKWTNPSRWPYNCVDIIVYAVVPSALRR